MSILSSLGTPGFGTERTSTHKHVFRGGWQERFHPSGGTISGADSRDPTNTTNVAILQPGLLMGRKTSGGKWAPSIIGVSTGAYTSGGTSLTVSAAAAAEIVRRIGSTGNIKVTGPPTAGGTVATTTVAYSAVNTSTGAITIADIGANRIAGSFVQPTDGSEDPVSLIPDGSGVLVVDLLAGTSMDVEFPKIAVVGEIDSPQIVNWPSDVALRAWIVARLNSYGQFVFSHPYST